MKKEEVVDTDGMPPGMGREDWELIGSQGYVRFRGKFYAAGGRYQDFIRPVKVVYALKAVYVLQDLAHKNIYVIDRKTGISLGCQMGAVFHALPKKQEVRDVA